MQWRGRWAQDDTQRKVVCRNFGGERGGASLLVLVIIPKLQRDWEKIQAGKELKSVILPQSWQRNSPFPGGAAGQNASPKPFEPSALLESGRTCCTGAIQKNAVMVSRAFRDRCWRWSRKEARKSNHLRALRERCWRRSWKEARNYHVLHLKHRVRRNAAMTN
jgi:hypothetical protein